MTSIFSWFHNLFVDLPPQQQPPHFIGQAMVEELKSAPSQTCAEDILKMRIIEIEREKEWLRTNTHAEVCRAVSDALKFAVDQYYSNGYDIRIYPDSINIEKKCFPFFIEEFGKKMRDLGVKHSSDEHMFIIDCESFGVLLARLKLDLMDVRDKVVP